MMEHVHCSFPPAVDTITTTLTALRSTKCSSANTSGCSEHCKHLLLLRCHECSSVSLASL